MVKHSAATLDAPEPPLASSDRWLLSIAPTATLQFKPMQLHFAIFGTMILEVSGILRNRRDEVVQRVAERGT